MLNSWLSSGVLVIFVTFATAHICEEPLGAENGNLTDDQFKASSQYNKWHAGKFARLNSIDDAWCPLETDTDPWIKVVFNETHKIKAVAIQGRNNTYSGWYVTDFEIWYLYTGYFGRLSWKKYLNKRFDGPQSKNDIVKIPVGFKTTQIMIKPKRWKPEKSFPCLRMELYGCSDSTPDFCKTANCSHHCHNEATQAKCTCPAGYRLGGDGKTCEDIDECAIPNSGICDLKTTKCVNYEGFYSCECLAGLEKEFVGDTKCRDANECVDPSKNICQQQCVNIYQSFECQCYSGFRLNKDGRTCSEIDECAEGIDKCDNITTTCQNTKGNYRCNCLSGLQHKTSTICEDKNECSVGNGGCDHGCHNIYRSYFCSCRNGTTLHSNGKTCQDIDECATGQHNCDQKCKNAYEGYTCECWNGYRIDSNKKCKDINECNLGNPCSHSCQNTQGSFICSCPKGYKLHADKKMCIDINECDEQIDTCDKGTSRCINNKGSYVCRCFDGFNTDPVTGKCSAKKCPALAPITNGYLSPPECAKAGTKQYLDVCSFHCNAGYELNDKSSHKVTCSQHGVWNLRGGFQPQCVPIKCPAIQLKYKMQVAPHECTTQGGAFNKVCQVYCLSGHRLVGFDKFICRSDGTYDRSPNDTKCVADKKLECPKDIKLTLPLGAQDMAIPLEKLNLKVKPSQLISQPAGVLTGAYRFTANPVSQMVILKASSGFTTSSCEFHVTVVDKEPPVITNCPPENVFITLNSKEGIVTWPEPTFRDNVQITRKFVNLVNSQRRGEQVYYVYYSANDAFRNEAVCRFFVHVKAKYCAKENIPGGDGAALPFFFPFGSNGLNALVNCQSGMFSKNITKVPGNIFRCSNGVWEDVPDCVPATLKTGDCPAGTTVLQKQFVNTLHCGKCGKGTKEVNGKCEKCPIGTYQDKYGSTSCIKCPQNTDTLLDGRKDISSCQAQCQPGEYSLDGLYGSDGCDRCPEGSYQDLYGQTACKVCHEGGISPKGSRSSDDCKLPARISSVSPESQMITAKEGDDVVISCNATGSPRPYMQITNATKLPPASFRGVSKIQPIVTGNKHISGMRLTITGVTKYDNAVYQCHADNVNGSYGSKDSREIILQVE